MKPEAWWHDACLAHDTGPGHPECAERLLAVRDALHEALPELAWREAPEATSRIRDELSLADGQWFFFDQALQRVQSGAAATAKPLSDVFVTSENLLSVMDRVTNLYANLKS